MPNGNEFSNVPYSVAHRMKNPLKRSPKLKPSTGESVDPSYLLQHENRFDPNVYTPEQIEKKPGVFSGKSEEISKT